MKRTLLVVFVVLLAGLSGCLGGASPEGETTTPTPDSDLPEQVERVVDEEAGVVCYMDDGGLEEGAGISCLPLNETTLQQ